MREQLALLDFRGCQRDIVIVVHELLLRGGVKSVVQKLVTERWVLYAGSSWDHWFQRIDRRLELVLCSCLHDNGPAPRESIAPASPRPSACQLSCFQPYRSSRSPLRVHRVNRSGQMMVNGRTEQQGRVGNGAGTCFVARQKTGETKQFIHN